MAKNLLSHVCPNGSLSEVISVLAAKFNKSRLEGNTKLKVSILPVIAARASPSKRRKYISIHTKRKLLSDANHCCEYQDPKTSRRCESRFFLEVEHKLPISLGGTNNPSNLRIFCREHNFLAAREIGIM
jgi:hypothetical protein